MGKNSAPITAQDIHPTGDPNIFRVESASDADKAYVVDVTGPINTCTCTWWAITRNRNGGAGAQGECKHLRAVEEYVGGVAHVAKVKAVEEQREAATEFERLKITESIKNSLRDLEGL